MSDGEDEGELEGALRDARIMNPGSELSMWKTNAKANGSNEGELVQVLRYPISGSAAIIRVDAQGFFVESGGSAATNGKKFESFFGLLQALDPDFQAKFERALNAQIARDMT